MNWKPHDRAIFVSVDGDATNPNLYGEVCRLIEYIGQNGPKMPYAWLVQFSGMQTCVNEPCLHRPPDDKHKRFHKALISSKWSDCEWNPMVEIER